MKPSQEQMNLLKAARFVIRGLEHDRAQVVEIVSNAVHRYRVKPHDLWLCIQLNGH